MSIYSVGQTWNSGEFASVLTISGFNRIVDGRSIPMLVQLGHAR